MPRIAVHPEISQALAENRPVVALESAVITCGLPRDTFGLPTGLGDSKWNASSPLNLELACLLDRTVRANNAIPATIAVIDGALHIGLSDDQLARLANDINAGKASSADLAAVMTDSQTAGTTVSATLTACALSQSKIQNPKSKIDCFATGGIGGVHRNWTSSPDISSDLRALASTPMCVVCAGAKNILDLPATLEALQMLGIPVVGHQTNNFPQFYCEGDDSLPLAHRVDDATAAAKLCDLHWNTLEQRTAILLTNPVPAQFALDAHEANAAIARAEEVAAHKGISGARRTPFVLGELARITQGRSLLANLALLQANAALAARVACAMRAGQ